MTKYATITITVPLEKIDFYDCGDGCGTVHGLHLADYRGYPVESFHSDDVEAAHEHMLRELGEVL